MARLKTRTVRNDGKDVHIECPHCDGWETHPIDEQRHHVQHFELVKWLKDNKKGHEVSIMKCRLCNNDFKVIWDYSRVIK